MKKSIFAVIMLLSLSANASEISDYADVIEVRPLMTQVAETRQSCTYETVQTPTQSRSYAGPIVGGVAGAIIGSQVGKGEGRVAATAAGAIAGTMVGENMSNEQQVQPQQVQRCQPYTATRNVQNGYEVTYRYNGKLGKTTTQYQPGSQIRVGINAE